jgi:RNA polymerase sigma factor (sigma-70 family)
VGDSSVEPQPMLPVTGPGERLPTTQTQERLDTVRRHEVGQLLLRARTGDRRSLDEIVDRLMPLVWNVARAQGLDVETASDVVQTTWVTLLEHLNEIRSPQALATWLITVTRREARRQLTLRRRDRQLDPDIPAGIPEPAGDFPASIADREQYRALWQIFTRLSPRCQQLLRIVAFVDRPNYQIVAEQLGMPRGSIGPTRGRCLAKLKALLAADSSWSM